MRARRGRRRLWLPEARRAAGRAGRAHADAPRRGPRAAPRAALPGRPTRRAAPVAQPAGLDEGRGARQPDPAGRHAGTAPPARHPRPPGRRAAVVAGMRKGLDSLVGAAAVVSIDERGFQHELSLGLPGGLGPELTQFMEAARIALGDLALPLPDEAIGVGAKWQVERTLDQGGVAVKEKTYYELIAAEGTRVQ